MDNNAYFDRSYLKSRAKMVLKLSYWKAFLAALVLSVATGGYSGGTGVRISSSDVRNWRQGIPYMPRGEAADQWVATFLPFLIGTVIVGGIVGIIIALLVLSPLEVGGQRYFLESTQHRFDLGQLGFGFSGGGYGNVVKTQFFRGLYSFLWSLLLVIPGIIKSYAYSMTPYLLAENPNLETQRAITLSREMTRGYRFQMFIFDLSFIGWNMLGALLFGIGMLFVAPYYYASKAELYLFLRTRAIDLGMTSSGELSRGNGEF